MDQFPDITIPPEDIKEDLAIIETEDLKSDPFVRQPPIKPPQPEAVKAKPKAKRQVSEKQKAHLANARKMARERKQAKKLEEEQEKKQAVAKPDIKEVAQVISQPKTDTGTGISQGSKVDGFEQFLGYMDQYSDMMLKMKHEEQRKREEAERKEKEMEAKYFKKFQEQQKKKKLEKQQEQSLDNIQSDVMEKKQPKKGIDILNPPTVDYGEYSSYF